MLLEILEHKKYSHLVMKQVLDKYSWLDKKDRAFIKRIGEGTIEHLIRIDYVINTFSKTKTDKMKPVIRTILRMSTYQILFMEAVPDSAACNEGVKLAAKKGFASLKGFVNGVLRSISRNKATISYPDRESSLEEYLSITYSMPLWIVNLWLADYGEETTERMLKGLLQERPVTIRIPEELPWEEKQTWISKMEKEGIAVKESNQLAYAYYLSNINSVKEVPGFTEGKFIVQDIGSMEVVEMAQIKEGDRVLDVCAAPGGKTLHAASKLRGTGMVEARDISDYKINLIRENIERTGYQNIQTKVWDATELDEVALESADVVIADLPCSGLGVIGRKGDIKYRVTKEDLTEIAALQRNILKIVSAYVKAGGLLIYSTCTINREENQENRDYILNNLPFVLEEEKVLLPGIEPSDGFYMARFCKKKENAGTK
ncbi:MAG: 16S rRNA (cytosine(967)-C(5))-methyltransferase RsmB [Roseburia sp.]|nr:16S rRNA (cytosine(967)-C(5))-methyltransferase RsmB [Roseburia sp.]MCM1278531.1 16S rRNA (cytosine(967)-C(5))-methyltransferase RsmB [Robinsoniella sp.]